MKVRQNLFIIILILIAGQVSAESQFSIRRQDRRGNLSALHLTCTNKETSIVDCKVWRTVGDQSEPSHKFEGSKAKIFFEDCKLRLKTFSKSKISSKPPHLQWSLIYDGSDWFGGTETSNAKTEKELLISLLAIESQLSDSLDDK